MSGRGATRRGEAGFTLTELLVVIGILSVIGVVLAETVVLALRTTDSTVASSSRSVAAQALASYFTDDAHSADTVLSQDPSCATEPVFLHLAWTDHGVARAVSYSLEPAVGTDQDLIRWSCSGGGGPSRRVIGHFTRDRAVPPTGPVTATCDDLACPATPTTTATPTTATSSPARVSLTIQAGPALSVTVGRRAGL